MAEVAQQTTNLDELLAEAGRVVERFRCAPAETQRDYLEVGSLVRLFKSLEKERKELLKTSQAGDLCLPISKAMFSLNQESRHRFPVEPSQRFVELYHFLVVVDPQPELLESEAILEEFKNAMIEARQVGLRLYQDAVLAHYTKKSFFSRLAKVCRAHERYLCGDPKELSSIQAEAANFELLSSKAADESEGKKTQDLVDFCREAELTLTTEQQFALLDIEKMPKYVSRCKERLRNGEALAILNELGPMVVAARSLSFGIDDPVLLSILAEAEFQAGDFESALKTFQCVLNLDPGPRNQGITWMLIGKVHLAKRQWNDALMAFTRSYESGQQNLAPLLKAASACRLEGDYNRAFEFLDAIEGSGRDSRPFVTKTVRARTHWAKFQDTGNEADGRAACGELLEVIQRSGHRDHVAVRYLTEMLSHPLVQGLRQEALETTKNVGLVWAIRQSLAGQSDVPRPILESVLQRLADPTMTFGLGKAFMGILTRALVRSYFAGAVGGIPFAQFVEQICGICLGVEPGKRREWLLELLVADRDAPSAELLRRYADAALKVIGPVISDAETARKELRKPELLDSLNAFLRENLPPGICPSAYGNGDTTDLRPELENLVEACRDRLREKIERGCSLQIITRSPIPVWGCWYQWIKARRYLDQLLGIIEGPLGSLASETAVWSAEVYLRENVIEVVFCFGPIDPGRNPSNILEQTEIAIAEWLRPVTSDLNVWWSDSHDWGPSRKIIISLNLPAARTWPPGFDVCTPFTNYLEDESRKILAGQGIDTGFFQKADSLFPAAHAAVFSASASEWPIFIQSLLDKQFALIADWLLVIPADQEGRHPKTVIHDLKKEVQLLAKAQATGQPISEGDVEKLRDEAFHTVARMVHVLRSEIFGDGGLVIDAGAVIRRFIESIRPQFTTSKVEEDYSPETFVEIHPLILESVVMNLVHNASVAALTSGMSPWISITVVKVGADEKAGSHVLLKVSNPYDPAAPSDPSGSGLGRPTVQHRIESLAGGRVFERPDAAKRIYEVGVLLPFAGLD